MMTTEEAFDFLFGMSRTTINDTEERVRLSRYKYSGRGLSDTYKAGDSLYEVNVTMWGSDGNGESVISAVGHSIHEALIEAIRQVGPWLEKRVERYEVAAATETKLRDQYKALLDKVTAV